MLKNLSALIQAAAPPTPAPTPDPKPGKDNKDSADAKPGKDNKDSKDNKDAPDQNKDNKDNKDLSDKSVQDKSLNDMSTQISGAVASSRALVSQLAAAYPALQAGLSNPYQSPIPAAMRPSLAPNALLQESDLSPTEVARLVSEFER